MTNEGILPQNQHLTIIPSGIKRHQHDLNCEDSGCEEVINMRYKNGVWKTVGEKATEWGYDHECRQIYYHAEINATGTNIFIGYDSTDHKIYLVDPDGSSKTALKQLSISPFETFLHFTSLNNILIVTTNLNVYYFKWDDNSLTYLELVQDIKPQVYFSYEHVDDFVVPPADTTTTEDFFQTQTELFDAILIAKYKMRQKGLYCHAYTVVQWAYRLWDGSYVMHSQPYLLRMSDEEAYFTKIISAVPTEEVYGCTLRCGKPIFYMNCDASVITNLEKYKGLITHFCVFMSQDVSQYIYEVNDTPFGSDSSYDKYAFSNNTESLDQLMKMYPLYLCKELKLDDVLNQTLATTKFEINVNESLNTLNFDGNGGSNIDTVEKIPVRHNTYSWKRLGLNWRNVVAGGIFGGIGMAIQDAAKNWNKTWYTTEDAEQTTETTDESGSFILQAQPELPIDDFSHHRLISLANPYTYNAKLHIGNINTKFWEGDDYSKWLHGSSVITTPITGFVFYREITIETDKGTRYVVDTFNPYYYHLTLGGLDRYLITFNNVISYPDLRATQIRIIYTYSGDTRELCSFDLEAHKMYNFAYAITDREFLSDDTGYLSYSNVIYYIDNLDVTHNPITTLQTDDRYYLSGNRIQVSRTSNALYNPSKYSYQIGNSAVEILCFASQSAPVSAGQFGHYPLTVFTSQGIFLLQQGGGDVIYAAALPLNNEVAFKNSVCELGGALVYASSDGIKVLAGNKLSHLSREIEGEPSDKLTADTDYTNFITDMNGHLVFLYPYLSAENFLDYLNDNVRICFDKMNKELIITNRDLFLDEGRIYSVPYSYVFNLQYKTWHKITDSWHQFLLINSVWYGARNYRTGYETGQLLSDMISEVSVLQDCLIQSRPMKWGTYDFKKPQTVIQRSLCHVGDPIDSSQDATDKFGLYMFASMENDSWKFVKGIKVFQPAGHIQHPALPGLHSSVRNVVLLTAVKSKDFVFSHWEVLRSVTTPGHPGAQARQNTESLIGDYNPDDYSSDYNIDYIETL